MPAFAAWHPDQRAAQAALRSGFAAAGHSLVETYSVLTRLPEPFRVAHDVAAAALANNVKRVLVLGDDDVARIPRVLAAARIGGGATYDGLIAMTAMAHNATLLTRDHRSIRTYRLLGAPFELV